MIAQDYIVPYLRLFPVWTFGPRYDRITGHYIDKGWTPDHYAQLTYRTEAEARQAVTLDEE